MRKSPSKGNDGQRVKSGSGAVFLGTKLTLVQVTWHCPGSICGGPDDQASPVQRRLQTSTRIAVHTLYTPP